MSPKPNDKSREHALSHGASGFCRDFFPAMVHELKEPMIENVLAGKAAGAD